MREALIFVGVVMLIAFALLFVSTFIGVTMDVYSQEGEPDYDDEFGGGQDSEAEKKERA